jgi:hypothetical protein
MFSEDERMDERYPELASRRRILREVYQRLEQAYEAGETVLVLEAPDIEAVGSELGFNRAKTFGKLNDLIQEGYLRATFSPVSFGEWRTVHSFITVQALTDRGLLEIGAIPDPRQRLILGFEGTIREIEADPRLDEEEKEKRINWAHEAVALVRGLSVELAARIITGELPPR